MDLSRSRDGGREGRIEKPRIDRDGSRRMEQVIWVIKDGEGEGRDEIREERGAGRGAGRGRLLGVVQHCESPEERDVHVWVRVGVRRRNSNEQKQKQHLPALAPIAARVVRGGPGAVAAAAAAAVASLGAPVGSNAKSRNESGPRVVVSRVRPRGAEGRWCGVSSHQQYLDAPTATGQTARGPRAAEQPACAAVVRAFAITHDDRGPPDAAEGGNDSAARTGKATERRGSWHAPPLAIESCRASC